MDNVTVANLQAYLKTYWESAKAEILAGTYRPGSVKRVGIPRPRSGVQLLGIPTIMDHFSPASPFTSRAGKRVIESFSRIVEEKLKLKNEPEEKCGGQISAAKVLKSSVNLLEPPYADRHVQWCERTGACRLLLPD